jgi:uridine kinase
MVIGLAGGSASGKSTLARRITAQWGERVLLIHHDDYYVHRPEVSFPERCKTDYERLEAIESALLVEHIARLKAGHDVDLPRYDFATHLRSDESLRVSPKPVVIVDGLMVLAEPQLLPLLDLRVFVDLDGDTRFIRRLQRDVRERGRSVESVIEQYTGQVKPFHDDVVANSRNHADLVVPGQDFERLVSALAVFVGALTD